jgi:hypothetical protein
MNKKILVIYEIILIALMILYVWYINSQFIHDVTNHIEMWMIIVTLIPCGILVLMIYPIRTYIENF